MIHNTRLKTYNVSSPKETAEIILSYVILIDERCKHMLYECSFWTQDVKLMVMIWTQLILLQIHVFDK